MQQSIAKKPSVGMPVGVGGVPSWGESDLPPVPNRAQLLEQVQYLEELISELDSLTALAIRNPHLRMLIHVIRRHLEARQVTQSSLVAVAGVPYTTAVRKLQELLATGLIEERPRTSSGKRMCLHPSATLLKEWAQFSIRVQRLTQQAVKNVAGITSEEREYYFGGSYREMRPIPPPQVLPEPLKLKDGLQVLVHADPTFMAMKHMHRQFEQILGVPYRPRAFSIDRLREEILRNAARDVSLYDIVAVDLPWIGELAEGQILLPLDSIMDIERLDPSDFHPVGWMATHWCGQPYAVPSQTTPELLMYRKDLFAAKGLDPPTTTHMLLHAAAKLHDPSNGTYGVAWNAARGTALGHTFMMMCADFGQPIFDLKEIAGGYDASNLNPRRLRPTIDTPKSLAACKYLCALMQYSPPDILSMSWYERIRPYAAGKVAMAYGYTLLVPYFELDPSSAAYGRTGYLPHPVGPNANPIAPVGGYALGIPANIAPHRRADAMEALIALTAPEAQKMCVQHGSRTNPRYSVGDDPEVRRLSPVFEVVDELSWRDELQFWPRPPVPQITAIISICGEEMHEMLRNNASPKQALARAQLRAEQAMKEPRQ